MVIHYSRAYFIIQLFFVPVKFFFELRVVQNHSSMTDDILVIPIFKDATVPKYKSGKWLWDDKTETFKYIAQEQGKVESECVIPTPTQNGCYQFRYYLDQLDEKIYLENFLRPPASLDVELLTVQDIKNFTLFMAPSKILTDKFIDFIFTRTVDKFLNALVIYFEYFLKVVEFLLIRRDELTEKYSKVQTLDSLKTYKMLADYLSQYRLLLAKEYCKIILGTGDMAVYHHIDPKTQSSRTISDRTFHECFISFVIYFTWVAHHRRAFKTIEYEINRLLRSGHFNLSTKDATNIVFTKIEQQILYGKNDRRDNFRRQSSPLVQEIINVSPENLPLLWIGDKKYRGTNPRFAYLEREFTTAESLIRLLDIKHGILGSPKDYHNSMLVPSEHTIRYYQFNEKYDPFLLVQQPYLEIPNWDNYIKKHKSYKSQFTFEEIRDGPQVIDYLKNQWKQRDKIVKRIKKQGVQNNILLNCQKEIEDMQKEIHIDKDRIIADFLIKKNKRKK